MNDIKPPIRSRGLPILQKVQGISLTTAAAQMMQQMSAMFAGLRIVTSVVVPTKIIDTNATEVEGDKASWVFDIDEDPAVLSKLDNTRMRVVFAGEGLSLPEVHSRD